MSRVIVMSFEQCREHSRLYEVVAANLLCRDVAFVVVILD
jgi:hypothetical protein